MNLHQGLGPGRENSMWFTAANISGEQNITADFESRYFKPAREDPNRFQVRRLTTRPGLLFPMQTRCDSLVKKQK